MAEPRPLAEDLALWLFEQRPKLLGADPHAVAETIAALGSPATSIAAAESAGMPA